MSVLRGLTAGAQPGASGYGTMKTGKERLKEHVIFAKAQNYQKLEKSSSIMELPSQPSFSKVS